MHLHVDSLRHRIEDKYMQDLIELCVLMRVIDDL